MKDALINVAMSLQGMDEITSVKPFGPMKPLATAIAGNPQLKGLSQATNAGLFAVDIIIMCALVISFFGFALVLLRYFFAGMRKHDETVDIKQEEAVRKQKMEKGLKGFGGVMAVFFLIPFLVSIVCFIIN